MKKMLAGLLALVMVLSLLGCTKPAPQIQEPTVPVETAAPTEPPETIPETLPPTEPTDPIILEGTNFPAGTVLYGVDISGMGKAEAYNALQLAAYVYALNLRVNDQNIRITAEALELKVSWETFDAYFQALASGQEVPVPALITYNEDTITNMISNRLNVEPQNAQIQYSKVSGKFEILEEVPGATADTALAIAAAKAAVESLTPMATASAALTEVLPEIYADSQEARQAQQKANDYLKLNLQYTYAPDNTAPQTETLTKSDIAAFITFDDKLNPVVSTLEIERYASRMNDKYQLPGEPGKFVTTGGSTIDLEVTYAGQLVDVDALRDDIYRCITTGISGTRTAPYLDKTETGDMSFGGNYVEINMSAQHLWVYKNGKCVVSTPVVTGCAYYGWSTPRGVYQINKKKQGAYLYGETYTSYVKYWMAFIGSSYGLHDASWREASEFGGDTYLYDGSHGCVNLPSGAAATVYNNISVGTHVILYGGATSAEPVEQVLTGTPEVSTALDTPLKLDVKPQYEVDEIIYAVADATILDVAPDGTVIPKALGTTTVTVTAPKQRFYTEATFTVTVTVTDPCLEGRHTCTVWTQATAPTCGAPGLETGVCDKCGQPAQREVPPTGQHSVATVKTPATCTAPAVETTVCTACGQELGKTETAPALGHSFTPEAPACGNGCGAENPDYVKPTDPTDPPEQPTDPTDPPEQPTDPPAQPTDPPVQPTDPPATEAPVTEPAATEPQPA